MIRRIFKFILIFALGAGLSLSIAYYIFSPLNQNSATYKAFDMNTWINDVFKLAVLEVQISQIHRFESKGLKVYNLAIPFTNQQSLIVTEGKVLLGYDLKQLKHETSEHSIVIEMPPVKIQSMELDFRFINETDSFLNRITPEVRNTMMEDIKAAVKEGFVERYQSELDQRNIKLTQLLQKISGKTVSIKKATH